MIVDGRLLDRGEVVPRGLLRRLVRNLLGCSLALDEQRRDGPISSQPRVPQDQDRRRITIQITPAAKALIEKTWGPLGQEVQTLLMRRNTQDLEVILDFLREGTRFQTKHAERIRRQSEV